MGCAHHAKNKPDTAGQLGRPRGLLAEAGRTYVLPWAPSGAILAKPRTRAGLSPPEVELARANFAEFDVDGDGLISHQDFVTAMSRHDPSWTAPNRRAQLDAMCALGPHATPSLLAHLTHPVCVGLARDATRTPHAQARAGTPRSTSTAMAASTSPTLR